MKGYGSAGPESIMTPADLPYSAGHPLRKAPCASADCNLMRPFPADLMRMWPISTRVNKPENDDSSIIEPIELESA